MLTNCIFVTANLMAITDGMAVGWTSPMIPYFLSDKSHIKMTRNQAEWLESYLLFGAFAGLPLTAFVTDKIGRKKSLILACSILVLTWVVLAIGDHVLYLNFARFFQGIGLNMAFVSAPMYVGEISHKSIRGFLSSTIFVWNVLGIVIIYVSGPYLPYYVPSIIANVILIVEIVVFTFLPESPYFLTVKGKHDKAEKSLQKFRHSLNVEKELIEIRTLIQEDNKEGNATIKEMILVKNYRKAFLIMIVLNSGQLFCCSEIIIMNLHEILAAAGSVYVSAATAGILFSLLNLVASTISSLIVDRFGRVKLLIMSVVLTSICLFLLALYFNLKNNGFDITSYSWLPIITVMTYGVVFKIGLGMVPIVMTSELFASRIKSFGMTFADGVYIASSVLTLQIFFALRDNFGLHVPFYVFCGCSILVLLFVLYEVPETKGRSLDEIQRILKDEPMKPIEEQQKMIDSSKQ